MRGSRLEQGAKAMLVRSNGVYFLCVMSAALKLDLKLVKVRIILYIITTSLFDAFFGG